MFFHCSENTSKASQNSFKIQEQKHLKLGLDPFVNCSPLGGVQVSSDSYGTERESRCALSRMATAHAKEGNMDKQSAVGEPHIHRTCGTSSCPSCNLKIKKESLLYSGRKNTRATFNLVLALYKRLW